MSLTMAAGVVFVWAATAAAAPPTNTNLPSITGTTKVGETLTAQNGTWTNSPTSFQYQWQRCDGAGASCGNIAGAVEKTYLVKAADASHTLRVRVLAVVSILGSMWNFAPTQEGVRQASHTFDDLALHGALAQAESHGDVLG